MKRTLPVLLGVLLLCTPAYAEVVDTCGQRVSDGELEADLDCSSMATGFAVIVEAGGSLDLAGHEILSGKSPGFFDGGAVECEGSCTVNGGGGALVSAFPRSYSEEAPNMPSGLSAPYRPGVKVKLSNLTITNYEMGVNGRLLYPDDVTATDNGLALSGRKVRVTDSTLTGNGQGIASFRANIRRTEMSGIGNGVVTRHAVIRGSTITGHGQTGVFASDGAKEGTVAAFNSTIDDNCTEQGYSETCHDFATSSDEPPALEDVDCTRSGRFIIDTQTWTDWDVCSED